MQKKIYVAPTLELFEMEPECMILAGSFERQLDPSNVVEENSVEDMSNKRQFGMNATPWE